MLRRQVRRHHRLRAPLDERSDPGRKVVLQRGVVPDIRVIAAECSEIAEHAGLQEVEDAPEVLRRIFKRRAGQHNPVRRIETLAVARIGGAGVLDVLRLVEHDEAEAVMLELVARKPGRGVGEDDQVVLRQALPDRAAFRSIMRSGDLEFRDELCGLPRPVVGQRGRTDDERRSHAALLAGSQQREKLDGFAEPHLVGQDHIVIPVGHVLQEADALLLIFAERPPRSGNRAGDRNRTGHRRFRRRQAPGRPRPEYPGPET